VQTNIWPLYEVDHGKFILNIDPKDRKPVAEWLKSQKRFKHLLSQANEKLVGEIQEHVDKEFARIKKRAEDCKGIAPAVPVQAV
jgi:pyruvate ferredoxin oxidoreductase beta subunit